MNALKLGIVSCAGLGLLPRAPGTFGTLGGVAIAWMLGGSEHFLVWVALVCVGVYVLGRHAVRGERASVVDHLGDDERVGGRIGKSHAGRHAYEKGRSGHASQKLSSLHFTLLP